MLKFALMEIQITQITDRTPELKSMLTELWERSVRATHHFLGEEDIVRLRGFVPEAISGIGTLAVAYENGCPVGFIGIESQKIEMLFIEPDHIGKGIGKSLLRWAIDHHDAKFIDVNEDNTSALAVYRHWGFREYERSATDDQGYPFPILRMKYE